MCQPFVAVGGMYHDGQVELLGQIQLQAKVLIFRLGHLVIANFPNGYHALFACIEGKQFHHLFCQGWIIGFLRVQTDGAVVANAKLLGSKPLPTYQAAEVVLETANIGTGLPQPEGRFNDGNDASILHSNIVIGCPGGHVDVGVNKNHLTSVVVGHVFIGFLGILGNVMQLNTAG